MELAVPRAVQGDERVSFPRGRKLIAFVEGEAKWRGVRLQQHVRYGDLALQVGPSAAAGPRVFMIADVIPRPAIEVALLYRGHVVRRQVVTQKIAFVGGAIDRPGTWLHREARAIADAGRVDAL